MPKISVNILNAYVFNGRCRVNFGDILNRINRILQKLIEENNSRHFSDESALKKVCACYLIKRCKNAALKGFVSSKEILQKTTLPVQIPTWLKIFNEFRKEIK